MLMKSLELADAVVYTKLWSIMPKTLGKLASSLQLCLKVVQT